MADEEKPQKEEVAKASASAAPAPTGKNYYTPIVIISVIMLGIMFNTNNSTFTTLISTIAKDLVPQGKFNPNDVGWIISIPGFLMIVGVLLNGILTRKLSMRNTMILGWAVYGIAGGCLFFAPSEPTILLCRALMGLGIGMAQPSTKALPAQLYGGNNRAKILGWINMGGGFINICIALSFGALADALGWRAAMLFFPIWSLLTIVFALLWVPSIAPKPKEQLQADGTKRPLGPIVWFLIFYGLVFYIISAVIQMKTSVMVSDLNLGAAGKSGIVVAGNCIGTFLGGFIFGRLYGKLGRWTGLVSLAAILIGYFGFYQSTTLFGLAFFGALCCFGTVGTFIPYMVTSISFSAPPERRSFALLLFTFSTYVGQILTTPWVQLIAKITGTDSAVTALQWTFWAYVVMTVIFVIFLLATSKQQAAAEAQGKAGKAAKKQ